MFQNISVTLHPKKQLKDMIPPKKCRKYMFHTKIPLGSIRVFFHLFSHMFYGFSTGKILGTFPLGNGLRWYHHQSVVPVGSSKR